MSNKEKNMLIVLLTTVIIILGIPSIKILSKNNEPIGDNPRIHIQMFNAEFGKYEGRRVPGKNVKLLINEIISNNYPENYNAKRIVTCSFNGEEGSSSKFLYSLRDRISATKCYSVNCLYDDEGYINQVSITEIK